MKNAFSCLLAILWPFLNAFCQPVTRPLTVGDAVPDYLIRNLVNYKTPTARLSDFKDKLLILDFMTTACGSCMVNLPNLDALEATYIGKVQILPVTYETKAKLLTILHKPFAGKKIVSPFAAGDSVLRSWFPHQFVSHMVWIHNGIVKAITKPEYVKAANIEAVLRNETIRWPVKRDIGHYDASLPLLIANPEVVAPANQLALKYYSAVSPYMEGFAAGPSTYVDTIENMYRFTILNESIIQLYLTALGKSLNFPVTSIVIASKDTRRFYFNGKGYRADWYHHNFYCYQASLPLQIPEALRKQKLLADLDFHLGLHGRLEQRGTRCLVLKRDSSLVPITDKPTGNTIQVSGIAIRMNGVPGGIPCFDEVPGSKRLYVPQPINFTDIPAIAALLLPYGIRITEEIRQIEMLVISDNTGTQ